MYARAVTVAAVVAMLVAGSASAAGTRPVRPDEANWHKVQAAATFRRLGLARHRTARFRSFAGNLGLSELRTVQPLAPGPCRRALTYLYGNLLDLQDAHPGENWAPLRRLVATEPSIRACAPRPAQPPGAT